jgi:hypothetical protein
MVIQFSSLLTRGTNSGPAYEMHGPYHVRIQCFTADFRASKRFSRFFSTGGSLSSG